MKWIWCVCWCGVLSVSLWCCSVVAPNDKPRTKYCLDNKDCSLGRVCVAGTCSIKEPGVDPILTTMPDDLPQDDLDNPEGPGADQTGPRDLELATDHGRSPELKASEHHIEGTQAAADQSSGRAADASPGTPTPGREPPGTRDTGSRKDEPKNPPVSTCKDGETRACYPEGVKGCATKDGITYHCITPCTSGKETCKDNTWGKCEGARTPANNSECTQTTTSPCPDGKPQVNGRCI